MASTIDRDTKLEFNEFKCELGDGKIYVLFQYKTSSSVRKYF